MFRVVASFAKDSLADIASSILDKPMAIWLRTFLAVLHLFFLDGSEYPVVEIVGELLHDDSIFIVQDSATLFIEAIRNGVLR